MTEDQISNAIYDWITGVTGVKAIFSMQDGPVPPKPYIEINVLTGPMKLGGQDDLRRDGEEFTLTGPRNLMCSINVHGAEAFDILSKAHDSLDDPAVIDSLEAAGLTVIDEGNPTDLSELQETHFETRFQMDVEFGLASDYKVEPDIIESAEVTSLI